MPIWLEGNVEYMLFIVCSLFVFAALAYDKDEDLTFDCDCNCTAKETLETAFNENKLAKITITDVKEVKTL